MLRQAVIKELERRCARNARYSLRALARSAGIDPGNLSRVVAGKAGLSELNAQKLAVALDLDPATGAAVVANSDKRRKKVSIQANDALPSVDALALETFAAIKDLVHAAILELTFVPNFRDDPKWLARELDLSVMEAKFALERLKTLGLIIHDGKKWIKATTNILRTAPGETTSPVLRRHQRQVLEKGVDALDTVPINKRVNVSMTFPMAAASIPLARELIERFSMQVCKALSNGERDSVFQLGICLFPLTTMGKEHRDEDLQ